MPQISLTAGLSSITSETFVLQNRDNPQLGVGATLFATLFDFGRLEAQADARRADQKQAAAIWAQTGLKAFGEVEGALSAEATLLDREPLLVAAVRQNNDALTLETTRYRIGSNDMRSVLQQQLALYSSRSALAARAGGAARESGQSVSGPGRRLRRRPGAGVLVHRNVRLGPVNVGGSLAGNASQAKILVIC